MSSALREVSGERGVWSLGLLSCRPEPLSPAGTSLVHHKLRSAGSCAPKHLLVGVGCSRLLRASPWAVESIARLGGRETQQSRAWKQQHLTCQAARVLQEPRSSPGF